MALPQTKFRELALQVLFRYQFLKEQEPLDASFYMEAIKTSKSQVLRAKEYVEELMTYQEELDRWIQEASVGYDLHRIGSVELNVLRLILFELIKEKTLSIEVAVSEGIRLAKKFSSSDAKEYVHALIDRVYKNNLNLV